MVKVQAAPIRRRTHTIINTDMFSTDTYVYDFQSYYRCVDSTRCHTLDPNHLPSSRPVELAENWLRLLDSSVQRFFRIVIFDDRRVLDA